MSIEHLRQAGIILQTKYPYRNLEDQNFEYKQAHAMADIFYDVIKAIDHANGRFTPLDDYYLDGDKRLQEGILRGRKEIITFIYKPVIELAELVIKNQETPYSDKWNWT